MLDSSATFMRKEAPSEFDTLVWFCIPDKSGMREVWIESQNPFALASSSSCDQILPANLSRRVFGAPSLVRRHTSWAGKSIAFENSRTCWPTNLDLVEEYIPDQMHLSLQNGHLRVANFDDLEAAHTAESHPLVSCLDRKFSRWFGNYFMGSFCGGQSSTLSANALYSKLS